MSHDPAPTRAGAAEPGSSGTGPSVEFGPLSSAVVRLGRAHRALASQLMREVGLRPEQGALMMHLWAVGPVRQSALAQHFGKDSAATTRTVQRLEHSGYLRRRSDPSDGRATLVEPTPAGNALRGRVEEVWGRLEAVLEAAVPAAERGPALTMLQRTADAVLAELDAEATRSLTEV
ncbi:MarR family winged helix-turn-helix transcriptional regulator [Kineococcus rubinsiae]|uniref:MarR family winged helix-turn-helix transcriptional regulator n=1 Tax=Kineococcus rubinsiae TaxID=2609562 RepID=UPI00142FB4D0|nr:MarR family winged helix-turn-helix transcriptional regulator [Kineococcus rubinsiae]NIZ91665.1 winged helix-turn-helix transcriptional regulator [Kineococcus rubinsiae]